MSARLIAAAALVVAAAAPAVAAPVTVYVPVLDCSVMVPDPTAIVTKSNPPQVDVHWSPYVSTDC